MGSVSPLHSKCQSRATSSRPHQSWGVTLSPALPPGTVLPPALRMHRLLLLSCLWLLAAPPVSGIFQRPTGTPGREQGLVGGQGAWERSRAGGQDVEPCREQGLQGELGTAVWCWRGEVMLGRSRQSRG